LIVVESFTALRIAAHSSRPAESRKHRSQSLPWRMALYGRSHHQCVVPILLRPVSLAFPQPGQAGVAARNGCICTQPEWPMSGRSGRPGSAQGSFTLAVSGGLAVPNFARCPAMVVTRTYPTCDNLGRIVNCSLLTID
jgi:hypothetical protein